MSAPLSNEALARLLAAATAAPLKEGATVVITSKDTAQASAVNAFLLCARPDTVAALVREVQQRREQVRTLEADNAALVAHAQEAAVLVRRWWMEPIREDDTPERAEAFIATSEALAASPHPGAALLAEMNGLRARVTVAEERASVLTTERNALLEQVRSLTEERDEWERESAAHNAAATQYESDIKALRARVAELASDLARLEERACGTCEPSPYATPEARKVAERVAELEARYAKSEKERGLALLAKQEHERAAILARDAALEEAEQRMRQLSSECDGHSPVSSASFASAADAIRALKAQPGKRFVDAEEVRTIFARWLADLRSCNPEFNDTETNALFESLGLTLDVETP